MVRRLVPLLLLALVLAGPAGADVYRKKREIDDRISTLNAKIGQARAREGVLTQEISIVTTKIRALEDDVQSAQSRVDALESELAVHQERLDRVTQVYRLEQRKLQLLRRAYGIALTRVHKRLIEAYETPSISTVDVMLSASSFGDLLEELEFVQRITSQDKQVSDELHVARDEMRRTVARTRALRVEIKAETDAVRARTDAQRAARDHLVSAQQQLATARDSKQQTLASVEEDKQEYLEEVEGLLRSSASLAAQIRSAQGSSGGGGGAPDFTPSSAGLVWPVNGPVTSGFGMRWGRMHEGIDIAASTGTPIRAAASGRIIYCGWMGGYGNLVAIDHGNGLSTAYGHQSAIAVGCGQIVAQGQTIGYVGSTGHSTGPHLHFEVRVNGQAVDPLGYL
jgi:murein DD-endopeptidase MepM/ murein hydrolase activator NlpD